MTNPAPSTCKICGAQSPLFGVVDFHKSCIEAQRKRLSHSGVPIYYRRCDQCGFVFTEAFDTWSEQDFRDRIYNHDYLLVDPEFEDVRPAANAQMIAAAFGEFRAQITLLDYGGGNGRLASMLRTEGFDTTTYDPFSNHRELPGGRFDLITCFEVLEHTPQPLETIKSIASLLTQDGLIFFSTLLQPADFSQGALHWWYASPRNGHVSLYSADALLRLFSSVNLRVASCSQSLHVAYRTIPSFASRLFIP